MSLEDAIPSSVSRDPSMIMIPTDRPVRSVERKRLTICLRIPPLSTPTGVGTMTRLSGTGSGTPVHPHGRGDNCGSRRALGRVAGSPPRAWGQSLEVCRYIVAARFTPTGVGTIISPARGCTSVTVHPHGRGDNTCVSGILMRFASKNKPRSHVPHQDGILTRKSPSTCMS